MATKKYEKKKKKVLHKNGNGMDMQKYCKHHVWYLKNL